MATKTKKQAPLRRAVNWGREVPLIAGKLVLITVVTIVLGLLFSSIQSLGADWLRILITGAVIFCCLALFFSEGLNKGASDAGSSRQMDRLEKAGKELTAKEEASCYHPLKALCGALLLFAVPLLLAAYVAICAKELNWARTTTYTVLKKLCQREIFDMQNSIITVLITRDEFHALQSEKFVNEIFEGSLPAFLAAFTSRKKLSQAEVDEIKQMVDSFQG